MSVIYRTISIQSPIYIARLANKIGIRLCKNSRLIALNILISDEYLWFEQHFYRCQKAVEVGFHVEKIENQQEMNLYDTIGV